MPAVSSEYTAAVSIGRLAYTSSVPIDAFKPCAANWKLVIAYDGTDFAGWQVQPHAPTIQGELTAAIERVTGERCLPQGSGRTDAGVHAQAQVASCLLAAPIPPANLVRALNRALPPAIRILSAEKVAADFHARHSAVAKTYEYRVRFADPFANPLADSVCLPWESRFVYAVERPLQLELMQTAASRILGTYDFSSFAASDPDRSRRMLAPPEEGVTNIRTVLASTWEQPEANLFTYRVTGNGFLHHMVRNLVGIFLEVGWGERDATTIFTILAARSRSAAGRTAPARGLFLDHVEYPDRTRQEVAQVLA